MWERSFEAHRGAEAYEAADEALKKHQKRGGRTPRLTSVTGFQHGVTEAPQDHSVRQKK